uniref:HECT domain-containing protein n=1 Tax=Heterorhabditis bacteriophora TaxID=37862 RepID=A0A1I7XGH8_HETBA
MLGLFGFLSHIYLGASSGIGHGAAIKMAKEGYALSLSGRNEEALMAVARECSELGVGDNHVNSAGILTSGPVIDTDINVYDKQMDVNVRRCVLIHFINFFSVVQLTRLVLPHLINTKGTVVNVSSITGPCPVLLDQQPTLEDLCELSPVEGRSLQELLDYQGDDFEDVFCLTFTFSCTALGQTETVDLKTEGSKITVTQLNKNEYVQIHSTVYP